MRCSPVVLEVPDPTDETGLKKVYSTDRFHKHRIDEVREEDRNGTSPTKVTTCRYIGAPAWAYDDSELLSEKARTWNQWRGYAKVRTLVGAAPDKRTQADTLYFRGMDGDKLPNGGKRDVKIEDSEGGTVEDHPLFVGQTRETLYYDGEGGALQSATPHLPGYVVRPPHVTAPTVPSRSERGSAAPPRSPRARSCPATAECVARRWNTPTTTGGGWRTSPTAATWPSPVTTRAPATST
ncbi:hypothetical protein KYY02_24250 [Streptomyces pimonensis]|uniref:Uncharacterized protein n=1 Tax=Streptomyces pimonensis TaxID=2860288 RepID=A0ABV4J432_9ACTN